MTLILFAAAVLLLLIALYGLLVTRNLIKIVIIIQILVKAGMLALVIAGKINGQVNLGQSMAVTVIVADTIVVVVGLALAIRAQSQFGTLDVDQIMNLES